MTENSHYYQEEYQEGFTTDLPAVSDLEEMKRISFAGTPKDFAKYIKILNLLGVSAKAKILDYGCSWGYGSWQFAHKGYWVKAFEISQPRATYAREKLKIDIVTDEAAITDTFDVIFSAHVLEHVPCVSASIRFGFEHLHAGGLFIAFTPNGSLNRQKKNFESWQKAWGLKHPNFLDEVFFQATFEHYPYFITSSDDEQTIKQWSQSGGQTMGDTRGPELLVIAKNTPITSQAL